MEYIKMDKSTAKNTQEKDKDRRDKSIKYMQEKDKDRRAMNKLIIKWFLPISTALTFIILMRCDKSKGFFWFPLSIIIVYVVFIIALILALAIINKSED